MVEQMGAHGEWPPDVGSSRAPRVRKISRWAVGSVLVAGGLALLSQRPLSVSGDLHTRSTSGAVDGQAREPPMIDWGGCVTVRQEAELVCVFDPGTGIELWSHHTRPDDLWITIDGEARAFVPRWHEGEPGFGAHVELSEGASRIEMGWADASSEWSLALRMQESPDAADRALVEARAAMEDHFAACGEQRTLEEDLEGVVEMALERHRLGDAVDMTLSAAHYLARRCDRPNRALALLDGVEPLASRYPQGAAELAARRGALWWQVDRLDDALRSLREASRYAVRLDDEMVATEALPMYAELAAELGFFAAAQHWAELALGHSGRMHPCHLASVLRTVGWTGVLLRKEGQLVGDPGARLRRAVALTKEGGECEDVTREAGAWIGLAELAMAELDPGRALETLERVDPGVLSAGERVVRADLQLRAMLGEGESPPEAALLGALASLEEAARLAGTPFARWTLSVRRGQIFEWRGQSADAERSYREAEDHLDRISSLAGLGVGRVAVGAQYDEGMHALLEILMDDGRASEALCIARRAQARRTRVASWRRSLPTPERARLRQQALAYVRSRREIDRELQDAHRLPEDERLEVERRVSRRRRELEIDVDELFRGLDQDARLPSCTELAPRRAGELLVGLYPQGEQVRVFAEDDDGTTALRLPFEPNEDMASHLLSALDARLERAIRIRVLAADDASDLDLHRGMWRGRPLGVRRPVAYGAELVPSPERSSGPEPRTALLVSDPTHTLPEAEAEIEQARAELRRAGWRSSVEVDSTFGTLEQVMGDVTLFHYAGHATHDEHGEGRWPPHAGGSAGWSSHLQLSRSSRLDAMDIVMLPAVPRVVVLSGCRTGVLAHRSGGISLATAFLAAGAEAVVAAPGEVDDREARDLGRRLYRSLRPGEPLDVVVAMHHAMRARWEAGEQLGRFRVWVH